MILDRHPLGDRYGSPSNRYLGFWQSKYETYLVELPNPAAFIDRGWDATERAQVIEYLRAAPFVQFYRGYSYCRICGKPQLGSREHGDGAFVWPEGFAHYVEEHGVKPPEEFLAYVALSKGSPPLAAACPP